MYSTYILLIALFDYTHLFTISTSTYKRVSHKHTLWHNTQCLLTLMCQAIYSVIVILVLISFVSCCFFFCQLFADSLTIASSVFWTLPHDLDLSASSLINALLNAPVSNIKQYSPPPLQILKAECYGPCLARVSSPGCDIMTLLFSHSVWVWLFRSALVHLRLVVIIAD